MKIAPSNQGFANQLLVCLLVTLGLGGSIGLGTVWMRHQISIAANHNRELATRITALERRIAETTATIEGEQGSEVLRRRNAEFRLGLAPASDQQVVRVTEEDMVRHAAMRNRDFFKDAAAPAVKFTLALKN
jgi:hypothetical protein